MGFTYGLKDAFGMVDRLGATVYALGVSSQFRYFAQ